MLDPVGLGRGRILSRATPKSFETDGAAEASAPLAASLARRRQADVMTAASARVALSMSTAAADAGVGTAAAHQASAPLSSS